MGPAITLVFLLKILYLSVVNWFSLCDSPAHICRGSLLILLEHDSQSFAIMSSTNTSTRCRKVLCWNVRGINSNSKWDSIRNKVVDSGCDVICLQETKKTAFDIQFLKKKNCPPSFDSFAFTPSVGASGGMLVAWKGSNLEGTLAFQNDYSISLEMKYLLNGNVWILTNIYAPCTAKGKREFYEWLKNIQMPVDQDRLIVGDFNLVRSPDNRNREGGDVTEMLLFKEAISALGLIEIPLLGKKITWSNKQHPPLLERLDWFFTSASWLIGYPNTKACTLNSEVLDHTPCIIEIATDIPKSNIFIFENYWMEHENFLQVVSHGWSLPTFQTDAEKNLMAKFKNLRRVLKTWQKHISSLSANIENVKLTLSLMEFLEEHRDLSLEEWNFKKLLSDKMVFLLHQQKIYWKQRGTIK